MGRLHERRGDKVIRRLFRSERRSCCLCGHPKVWFVDGKKAYCERCGAPLLKQQTIRWAMKEKVI